MSHAQQGTLAAIAQLRAALEDTAAALAAADLDRLLAGDMALQSALTALPSDAIARLGADPHLTAGDRASLKRDREAISAALLRCRRLGAGLTDFMRVSLEARGGQVGYDADPAAAAAALGGRVLAVRA
jgi:hypothetical protein